MTIASNATNDPLHPRKTADRRAFVILMIVLASLIFVATEGLLYYRWATMVEPTCVLIVDANEALRGAEVVVDGMKLPTAHRITLGEGERFAIPFYLEPGRYAVTISRGGAVLYHAIVDLTPTDRGKRLDLTKWAAGPRTAAVP